jgi:ribonuclease BN (tRNA processing enzyme)
MRVAQAIDAVIVTHFHLDHCGALPYFTEVHGYHGPIYMTYPTKALVPLMLEDFRKVPPLPRCIPLTFLLWMEFLRWGAEARVWRVVDHAGGGRSAGRVGAFQRAANQAVHAEGDCRGPHANYQGALEKIQQRHGTTHATRPLDMCELSVGERYTASRLLFKLFTTALPPNYLCHRLDAPPASPRAVLRHYIDSATHGMRLQR